MFGTCVVDEQQHYINDLAELESRNTRRSRTASLQHMRAHKRAGTGNVTCSYCNVVEPGEVKFNVCSQCQSVLLHFAMSDGALESRTQGGVPPYTAVSQGFQKEALG